MLRWSVIAILVGLLTAGCAGEPRAEQAPALSREAEVYVQVLRKYLGTPSDNSFPGHTFTTVYVLDRALPDAADPSGKFAGGTPIGPDAQRHITAALVPAQVVFIADRSAAMETSDGCPRVRDGGILITLGPADGDDHEVRVAINGFVACLGATWLTYVVRNQPGSGWRVTGTTGSMAVA